MRIKYIICIFLLFKIKNVLQAQNIVVNKTIVSYNKDSSIYCSEEIDENRFWLAGENGRIIELDSQARPINYHQLPVHIYKLINTSKNVYAFCNKGILGIYNKENNLWVLKHYSRYKKDCFYGAEIFNNEIYICGGRTKIAYAKKVIPHGFIIKLDSNFFVNKVIYKSINNFPFAICVNNNNVLVSVYNIFRSKAMQVDGVVNKKMCTQKFLVHDMHNYNNKLVLCGVNNFSKKIKGRLQFVQQDAVKNINLSAGMLWALKQIDKYLFVLADKKIFIFNNDNYQQVDLPNMASIYTIIKIAENKILVAGNGGLYTTLTLLP